MNRSIRYTLILCSMVLCGGAYAADRLDTIIVSATRSASSLSHVASSARVYTQEDLKALPARDLAEALSYLPGINIQPSGNFGQSTAVSIRGADSRQVLVMMDGIPFNTQLSGQANLSRIPLENIEQIEIVQGGSSSQWGSSLGGVIHVITKDPLSEDGTKIKYSQSFAEFATSKESMLVQSRKGKWGVLASGSYFSSDGNRAQSFTRETKTFSKLTYDINEQTRLKASYGYSGAHLRYGPTNAARIFDQPYISRYGLLGIEHKQQERQYELVYKSNDQDVSSDTYNSTTKARVSSTISHDFYQGVSVNTRQELSVDGVLSAGADFDWHELKSSQFLKKSKSSNAQGPYVNYTQTLGDWDIQPGLRYDHNNAFGS